MHHPQPTARAAHQAPELQPWQRTTLAAEQRARAQGANACIVYMAARRGGKRQALAQWAEQQQQQRERQSQSLVLLCRGAVAAADHDIEGAGLGDFSQASTPMPPAPAEASTELGYLSGTGPAWRRTRRYRRPLIRRLWACRPGLASTAALLAVAAALGMAMHSDYHELVLPQALLVAEEVQP